VFGVYGVVQSERRFFEKFMVSFMVRPKHTEKRLKWVKFFPKKYFFWGDGALFIMGINTPKSRLKYG